MTSDPWSRVDFDCSQDELVNMAVAEYGLGQVIEHEKIQKGVIEVNLKVTTTSGNYVLKVFSNKCLPQVKDILGAQQRFLELGIQVPHLFFTSEARPYFVIKSRTGQQYYGCVVQWFDGDDYTDVEPTEGDLRKIACSLAKIHTCDYLLKEIYDECFPTNLVGEYYTWKGLVEESYIDPIEKIVRRLEEVKFSRLEYGIIHGDLSREHVLRNEQGSICILDFGAVNSNPIIIDLAFMMSYYCLNVKAPSGEEFENRYNIVLEEYLRYSMLSDYEIQLIPMFIQASFATCYLIGRYFLEVVNAVQAEYLVWFGELGLNFQLPRSIGPVI